ncbi:carbohydrate ABC transporter permease [Paenibacillus periandrae]|uniref:carbohydrate ABC transporter permease n=1 Tax=Paenibacillus periandrae TaxID=1761741 RepID=UPI001F08A130|nr:carbohydrate ABC transporter permease [Paenibacillus periandrae]
MLKERSWPSLLFDSANLVFLIAAACVSVFPFLFVLVHSFSLQGSLVPSSFSLEAYRYLFSTPTLVRSLLVSIGVTVSGTAFSLALTSLTAYPLSKKNLDGRRGMLFAVLFTILFSGGMIPTYFVVKGLGMIDSYSALILPAAVNAFHLIVMKNFFQQLPEGLEESAKIDGCNDFRSFMSVALPLSAPSLATFALFYAVHYWNEYVDAILYINSTDKWPVQVLLRKMIIIAGSSIGDSSDFAQELIPPQSIRMAVIVVSTIPIMLVYPFLQKHFAKGMLLGSVKG